MKGTADKLWARCDHCGGTHEAELAHLDAHSGAQLYAVICPQDQLTEWVTSWYLTSAPLDLGPKDARGFYREWGLA
jgi:hypothetical protein